jgi:hypothetical protein
MTVLIIWECLGDQLQIFKENITDPSLLDELKIAHRGVLSKEKDEKPEVKTALESVKKFLEERVAVYDTDGAAGSMALDPLEFNQFNYPKLVVHCCEIL